MTKLLHSFIAALMLCLALNAKADDSDITTVIDADFTQFTSGTPENPVAFPSYGTGAFTSVFPNWSTSKISQAGGSVLIADGGYIQTAYKNLSANGGMARITVKVKAMDSYGGIVKISVGYSSANSTSKYVFDNEWHEISVVLAGGTSMTRVKIEPSLSASGILVESIRIEQSASFFTAPTANQPSQADGTSFTATWSNVTGATAYYLDVYSYNADGSKNYVVQNENCGTLRSKTVDGLNPGTTYYYVVRASNGSATSDNSNEIEVVRVINSIDIPEVSDATVANGKASFSWNPVENASSYIVTLFRHTTLAEDSEVDVVNDDFAKVQMGTFESIEFISASQLDNYTNLKGWGGSDLALCPGNIVLAPFSSDGGYLTTPGIDLSSDNGSFTVTYSLAEASYGYYYSGGTVTVNLLDPDDQVIESKTATLKNGYTDYDFTFTKGTADSRVQIAYSGDRKLFIDSIRIKQLMKAGSVIKELISEENVTGTSYEFDYAAQEGVEIGYTVMAVGRTVISGNITEIESDPSDEKFIKGSAAIGSVESESIGIKATGAGSVEITTPVAVQVDIYTIDGRSVLSVKVQPGTTTVECPSTGIAIVKAGDKTAKIKL